jgi:hypothetical protein
MAIVRLETGKLKDIDERYYYGATCSKCQHRARLSIRKLKDHLGEEFLIDDIRKRLRCERCGNRQCVIAFLAPESMSGSLVKLKNEKPSA